MSSLAAEYRRKLTTPEEAVRAVKSGDWVDYGHFAAQAVVLDEALARRRDELTDVKIRQMGRCFGPAATFKVDPQGEHFTNHSLHFTGIDRRAADAGGCFFVPVLYHEVPRYYRDHLQVDVAFVPVTPMDAEGNFNFSISCSHARAVCDSARHVVLEVNPRLPRCLGGRETSVHLSEVDAVVEAEWPVPQIPAAEPGPVAEAMAALIVERLRDGCCLQLGIGGLPAAIGRLIARSDLRDLGVHTEMFTDAFIDVIEAGRVTGARKTIDPGKVVYTFAAGTERMYRWLDGNPVAATYPVDYTNDPLTIRQLDDMVAINSCLEIDLLGQVSSESAGGRQISGTGGQMDFTEGAYHARRGQSFLCTAATHDDRGTVRSRIVPRLHPGTVVTTPRSVVSNVATEFGVVNLKGKSTWERAEALISLADPRFRGELVKEAEAMGIWRRSSRRA